MLLLPFVVGTVRGVQDAGFRPVALALGALWLVGYLAYFAAGLWLKSRRRPRYRRPMLTYGALAAVLGAVVLALDPALAAWAPAFVPFLALGLWASAQRTERSVAAGGAMTVAASLMTAVAYTACRPAGASVLAVPAVVWLVAALLLAYLFGTVLYVKTMIRERGVRSYVVASVAYHAVVVAVAAGVVAVVHDPTWWWATAFLAAATVRAAVLPGRPMSPKAVGIGRSSRRCCCSSSRSSCGRPGFGTSRAGRHLVLPNAGRGCRTVGGVRWFTGAMDDDAPLTLPALGERVEAVSALYARKFGVDRDPDWFMLKLTEEVGELTQAFLVATGRTPRGLRRVRRPTARWCPTARRRRSRTRSPTCWRTCSCSRGPRASTSRRRCGASGSRGRPSCPERAPGRGR